METTVTGLFANGATAERALKELRAAGFGAGAIEVITNETENRHELLVEETSDVMRGARLGAVVGAIGMALGGLAMAGPLELFDMGWFAALLLFGTLGAFGGTVIGLLIGSATGHQVQQEYEHMIDAGAVLLAVNTSGNDGVRARALLERTGASHLSTSVHRAHRGHARASA